MERVSVEHKLLLPTLQAESAEVTLGGCLRMWSLGIHQGLLEEARKYKL
jgi:hypothetical protein